MTNLVLNVSFDFFSRHEKGSQISKYYFLVWCKKLFCFYCLLVAHHIVFRISNPIFFYNFLNRIRLFWWNKQKQIKNQFSFWLVRRCVNFPNLALEFRETMYWAGHLPRILLNLQIFDKKENTCFCGVRIQKIWFDSNNNK